MNILIREAEEKDLEIMSKLYVTNWHATYMGIVPNSYLEGVTEASAYEKWNNYVDDEIKKVYVAYADEKLVGIGACKKDLEIEKCLCLDVLHVDEACRNKGVGTALIEINKEYMKSLGWTKLRISIICGNDHARSFYMNRGAKHLKYYDVDFKGTNVQCEKLIIE